MIGFVVESIVINQESGEIGTEGSITTVDYGEHCWDFTNPWKARRESRDEEARWVVDYEGRQTSLARGDYVTARAYLHAGVTGRWALSEEQWIAAMLDELMTRGREVLEIKEYDGQMEVYHGDCVCKALLQPSSSTADCEALWARLTGGCFPSGCFQCSCDQRWHYSNEGWHRVSKKAFEVLTKYNGRAMRLMVIHKGIVCLPEEIGGHWL